MSVLSYKMTVDKSNLGMSMFTRGHFITIFGGSWGQGKGTGAAAPFPSAPLRLAQPMPESIPDSQVKSLGAGLCTPGASIASYRRNDRAVDTMHVNETHKRINQSARSFKYYYFYR